MNTPLKTRNLLNLQSPTLPGLPQLSAWPHKNAQICGDKSFLPLGRTFRTVNLAIITHKPELSSRAERRGAPPQVG
jgi:hypothetical protein